MATLHILEEITPISSSLQMCKWSVRRLQPDQGLEQESRASLEYPLVGRHITHPESQMNVHPEG